MSLQEEYPWKDTPSPTVGERIRAAIDNGIHQAKQLTPQLRSAMLGWGEAVLTRQALWIAESGLPPDGHIGNPAWGVEVELAHRLSQGDRFEALQGLWELLPSIASGAVGAQWYSATLPIETRQQAGLRFRDATLPPLLLARQFLKDPARASQLLPKLQPQQSWAEVAWALVMQGEDPLPWLAALENLDYEHAEEAPARVAWACAALGALPKGYPVDDRVCATFNSCIAALMWLAPAAKREFFGNPENRNRPLERQSPWFLERRIFLRSILHLAQASQRLGTRVPLEWQSGQLPKLSDILNHFVTALGIEPRLNKAEQRALTVLCCPQAVVDLGWLDADCWRELTAIQSRLWHYQHGFRDGGVSYNVNLVNEWLDKYVLPAIWRSDSSTLHQSLIIPPTPHTLPLLVGAPSRLQEWLFLYKRELPRLPVATAAQCWVTIAVWSRWAIHAAAALQVVEEARDALLAQHGEDGWSKARDLLIEQLPLSQFTAYSSSSEHKNVELALLRHMSLTSEQWAAGIADMNDRKPLVPLLLEAGAPVMELGRLLVKQTSDALQRDEELQGIAQELLPKAPRSLLEVGLFADPKHLAVLAPEKWKHGPWLPALLSVIVQPADELPNQLVRQLALYSEDREVRSTCLRVLIAKEDQSVKN